MRKKIHFLKVSVLIVAASFCFFFGENTTNAHPLIPLEVLDYMNANPEATDEEIETFFLENFGSIEQYYGIPPEEQDFTLKELYMPPEDFLNDPELSISPEEQQRMQENITLFLSLQDEEKALSEIAKGFIILGFEHILIGLDHILFVLTLVLVLSPWRQILAMVTTFTIAHSLTLILAGTETLSLSAKIVEPIIAFSIAYMAITTVFMHREKVLQLKNKLLIIFLFGLFHGLGFAGVFGDLQVPKENLLSSLLFFNVGVELGQIAILMVAVPLLMLLQKWPKVSQAVIHTAAFGITILALYWVAERIAF